MMSQGASAMEVFSIRSSQSFQFNKHQKSQSQADTYHPPSRSAKADTQFPETETGKPNYEAISVAEMREIARVSYESGAIDQDTFVTLNEGLPMQAIDPKGQIVDFSGIGETTPFNFKGYYQDQLAIAASIGDPKTRSVLESVLTFMNS